MKRKLILIVLSFVLVCSLSILILDKKDVFAIEEGVECQVTFYLEDSRLSWVMPDSNGSYSNPTRYGYFSAHYYNNALGFFHGSADGANPSYIEWFDVVVPSGFSLSYRLIFLNENDTFTTFITDDLYGSRNDWVYDVNSYIDRRQDFVVYISLANVPQNNFTISFQYNDSVSTSKTDSFSLPKYTSFDQNNIQPPIPPTFNDEFFIYWKEVNSTVKYSSLEVKRKLWEKSTELVAIYSGDVFSVTFYYNGSRYTTLNFPEGYGTIQPPTISLRPGDTLIGFSLRENGALINFDNYLLDRDVDIYAVTTFSSQSSGAFDIPYQDCSALDITCHLSNAFIYFLNEFPIVSNIVDFIYPIGRIFTLVFNNIAVFDSLGWIFTFSLGILFIFFVFKLMR